MATTAVEDEIRREIQSATRTQVKRGDTGWGNKKASWWKWHLQWFSKDTFQQREEAAIRVCMKTERQWDSSGL